MNTHLTSQIDQKRVIYQVRDYVRSQIRTLKGKKYNHRHLLDKSQNYMGNLHRNEPKRPVTSITKQPRKQGAQVISQNSHKNVAGKNLQVTKKINKRATETGKTSCIGHKGNISHFCKERLLERGKLQ